MARWCCDRRLGEGAASLPAPLQPIHDLTIFLVDHGAIDIREFAQHGLALLRREVLHRGLEEVPILFLDVAGVEADKLSQGLLDLPEGGLIAAPKTRVRIDQPSGQFPSVRMLNQKLLHQPGNLGIERLTGKLPKENVFFFTMMGAIRVGVQEVGDDIDIGRDLASLGQRSEMKRSIREHALDQTMLDHQESHSRGRPSHASTTPPLCSSRNRPARLTLSHPSASDSNSGCSLGATEPTAPSFGGGPLYLDLNPHGSASPQALEQLSLIHISEPT